MTNAVENIPFCADKHLLFLIVSFEMKGIFNKTIHEYKSEYYNKNKYSFCRDIPVSDTLTPPSIFPLLNRFDAVKQSPVLLMM